MFNGGDGAPERGLRILLAVTICTIALVSNGLLAQNLTFRYFYDGNHQLTGVLDSSGNLIQYVYDPAGNPTQINRSVISPGQLSVLNFLPQRGSAGTTVTIQGQGFSATPANNTVRFNGVLATVVSASATQLVVTVPSGATTGPLSVAVGGTTVQGGTFTIQTRLISLSITPSGPSIVLGTTQQFTATGTYSDNSTQNLTALATWSSSAPNVATIANAPISATPGLATSLAIGTTTITANYTSASGTVSNSTTLTVTAAPPISITITPSSPSINVGATQQLTATGTFTGGSMQNLTTTAVWSSSNPAVATVSNAAGTQGQVIGLIAGMSMITATVGTVVGTTALTVTASTVTQFPRFLYVTDNQSITGISVYSVNALTGQLRPLSVAPLTPLSSPPSYGNPPAIAGSFLYLPGTNGFGQVDGYALNPTNGSLSLLPGSPFSVGIQFLQSGSHPIVVTPSGQFAYAVAAGVPPLQAAALSINPTTGALTVASQTSFGASNTKVADIALDPQGRFLYIEQSTNTDFTLNPELYVFSIDPATGAATPVTGSPFSGAPADSLYQVVTTGNFVYALDEVGRQVLGFSVNGATGALTPIPGSPFSAGFSPAWMTVTPSGNSLYVQDTFFPGSILAFSINSSTGALTKITGSPFATPQGSTVNTGLASDPSGKYLYASVRDNSAAAQAIATYSIDPGTGSLSLLSSQLSQFFTAGFGFLQGTSPVSYTPAFAYTANSTENDLSLFSVNSSTGAFTPLSSSPLAGFQDPKAVNIDPLGAYALTVDQNGLRVFGIDPATGLLSVVTGTPTVGTNPASVVTDPLDRFVFVVNQGSNNISAFRLNAANGKLTAAPGSPFAAGATPVALAADPSGQVLLAANSGSGNVSEYSINPTNGALSANATLFAAGTNPVAAAIEATSHYAYVVNQGSNNISVYSIHIGAPGPPLQLTTTVSLPAGTTLPQAVTIDPTGHFLYVAGGPSAAAGTVSAFTLNPATGALTPVSGSPFPAGLSPASVTVDPSGTFLYVTNSGANNVSTFSINPSSGALSPVPAPVTPAGATPVSTAVAPKIQ